MSNLRVDTLSDKVGTGPAALTSQWALKAWAKHDNAGIVQDSENVSSVSDDGTGLWTVTFISSFLGADNFAASTTVEDSGSVRMAAYTANTSSTLDGDTRNASTAALIDAEHMHDLVVGDLA